MTKLITHSHHTCLIAMATLRCLHTLQSNLYSGLDTCVTAPTNELSSFQKCIKTLFNDWMKVPKSRQKHPFASPPKRDYIKDWPQKQDTLNTHSRCTCDILHYSCALNPGSSLFQDVVEFPAANWRQHKYSLQLSNHIIS